MSLFKDFTRKILLRSPKLGIIKEAYKINDDDLIKIVCFIQDNQLLQVRDFKDVINKINDENILKRYFSNQLPGQYEYLVFIMLGIEYLLQQGELEDAQKGCKILFKKIDEEIKKCVQ